MNVNEALALIKNDSITRNKEISWWADLGCGEGVFTHALSRMLQPGSIIYGIDKKGPLKQQITANGIKIMPLQLDFVTADLGLQNLDGVLMANALHYVKDKGAFIQKIKACLKPGAPLLIVEYDTDIPVPVWVPYPVSFVSLKKLFEDAGYHHPEKLSERPSIYGRKNMYSLLVAMP